MENRGHQRDEKYYGLLEEFYENGQLRYSVNYIDGKQEGLRESFHENGQLNSRANYIDGEPDGLLPPALS